MHHDLPSFSLDRIFFSSLQLANILRKQTLLHRASNSGMEVLRSQYPTSHLGKTTSSFVSSVLEYFSLIATFNFSRSDGRLREHKPSICYHKHHRSRVFCSCDWRIVSRCSCSLTVTELQLLTNHRVSDHPRCSFRHSIHHGRLYYVASPNIHNSILVIQSRFVDFG
jgi:hypothetical protein